MYKIIGADHNEYGPSSAEEIRQWVREGRADGRTLVKVEGANEWKPLASFPEFADDVAASPSASRPSRPADPKALAAQILAASPDLRIGECLGRGWKLLMANFGLLFTATVLVCVAVQALQFVPLITMIAPLFKGVFFGGLYLVFLRRMRGQPATVGEGFSGFGDDFGQLLLAGVVGGLLTFFGFTCCLFMPGIYLYVAWTFAFPLVADKKLGFWSALELSRKVVTRYWFQMAVLLIVAFLPVVLLGIYFYVDLWNYVSSIRHSGQLDFSLAQKDPAAFRAQIETLRPAMLAHFFPLVVAQQITLLVVQPFGKAVVATAYETLFNPRPKTPA